MIRPELADDPAFIRRFEAEAQLVAGLEHPHIVPLYDYWREPGAAYLVMRLVDAGSLADVLADGALPADRAATVVRPARQRAAVGPSQRRRPRRREAGEHPHRRRRQRLPDRLRRGLAGGRRHAEYALVADRAVRLARAARSRRPLSPASDQYSLAVVAATALTGMGGEYEQVRGALAPAVRAVLDRATAADPARRYADVAAFGRALTEALGVTGTPLLDDTAIENPYKGLRAFGRRRRGRLLRAGTTRRTAHRPPRRTRHPRTVRGRRRAERERQVERRCEPGCCRRWRRGALPMSADWFRVEMTPAPHPFEELEAALAANRVATHRPRCSTWCSPRGRAPRRRSRPARRPRPAAAGRSTSSRSCSPRSTTTRRPASSTSSSTSSPRRGTRVRVVVTLRADFYDRPLRHRGARRAAPRRHRGDHADVDRGAGGGDHRPGRQGRRRRRPARRVGDGRRDRRPSRAPCRCCSTR